MGLVGKGGGWGWSSSLKNCRCVCNVYFDQHFTYVAQLKLENKVSKIKIDYFDYEKSLINFSGL